MIAADALLDEFVTALRVGMERRVDFLTAVRDNPPHDIQRLYWLPLLWQKQAVEYRTRGGRVHTGVALSAGDPSVAGSGRPHRD